MMTLPRLYFRFALLHRSGDDAHVRRSALRSSAVYMCCNSLVDQQRGFRNGSAIPLNAPLPFSSFLVSSPSSSSSAHLTCVRTRLRAEGNHHHRSRVGPSALFFSVAHISLKEADILVHGIKQIIRGNGPTPVAHLSKHLTDDVLELLEGVEGGLAQFIRDRPSIFNLDPIVSPSGVRSGFMVSLLKNRTSSNWKTGPIPLRSESSTSATANSTQSDNALLASVLETIILSAGRRHNISNLYKQLPQHCKRAFFNDSQFIVWLAGKLYWFDIANSSVELKRHTEARAFIDKVKRAGISIPAEASKTSPQESFTGAASRSLHPGSSSGKLNYVPPAPSAPHVSKSPAFMRRHSQQRGDVPFPKRMEADKFTRGGEVSLRTKRMVGFLEAHAPYTFYIPLSSLLQIPGCALEILGHTMNKQEVSVAEYVEAFKSAPPGVVDCRSFGSEPNSHTVFVRLLDCSALMLHLSQSTEANPIGVPSDNAPNQTLIMTRSGRKLGDAVFHTFNVLLLSKPILEDIRSFLASCDQNDRHRLASGVHMCDLPRILSEPTLRLMRQTLCPHEAVNLPDEALILIFDRLRHIFHVDLSALTVALWCLLPDLQQPSSLSAETTPLPLVLCGIRQILEDETADTNHLAGRLPASLIWQLKCMFDDTSMITKPVSPPPAVISAAASETAAQLVQFVALHSLYLFFRDGKVCTPQLAASLAYGTPPVKGMKGNSAKSTVDPDKLTESDKALMIFERLPKNAVNWDVFKWTPALADLPFPINNFNTDSFLKHRSLFIVHEALFFRRPIIGRIDGIPPPSHLLIPPVHSLSDLLRLIALLSAGGIDETALINFLSRDGRKMLKRFGGSIELIVRQVPQWFEVRNDLGLQGQAIITYIGADAGAGASSSSSSSSKRKDE